MRSFNKVFLMGRVGSDPEPMTTKGGQTYTRLSIATSRSWKYKDDPEARHEATDWHSVMVWGNLAKICLQGVKKGLLVFVEGHLNTYSVVSETGEKQSRSSLHAQKVSFFSLAPRVPIEGATLGSREVEEEIPLAM